MRLTIIPSDRLISVNARPITLSQESDTEFNACNIPENIHALQWYDTKGWIEFNDPSDPFTPKQSNEEISKLPEWANALVNLYNAATVPVVDNSVVASTNISFNNGSNEPPILPPNPE